MTSDVDLTDRERAVVNGFQGGFPVAERPFEPAAAAMRDAGVDITYNVFAMTHGRSEAEGRRRIGRLRETMAEYRAVGDEDWDSLFSTQILKKTGIRLAERAAANTADDLEAA